MVSTTQRSPNGRKIAVTLARSSGKTLSVQNELAYYLIVNGVNEDLGPPLVQKLLHLLTAKTSRSSKHDKILYNI